MERTEVEREIEVMIRASPIGGIPFAAVDLARKRLRLSHRAAEQFVRTVYDAQASEWRASVDAHRAQRLLAQFREELELRLTGLARECGWRPEVRELSPTEASAWCDQLRERFELPSDIELWHALWHHKHAHDAAKFHEEVLADEPRARAGQQRSYRKHLTGTFADYLRIQGLPQDGVTRAVYGYGLRFSGGLPLVLPLVLEMATDDAARCLHAIYSIMVSDILVVDRDLRWVVCVFHHGTTRLIRPPDVG